MALGDGDPTTANEDKLRLRALQRTQDEKRFSLLMDRYLGASSLHRVDRFIWADKYEAPSLKIAKPIPSGTEALLQPGVLHALRDILEDVLTSPAKNAEEDEGASHE